MACRCSSFHCDALLTTQDEDGNVLAYSSLDNSETRLDCDFYLENKVMSDERCAPWDQLFGFFYGDGTSSRVLMEMTETPATTAAGLGEYRYQVAPRHRWSLL